MSSTEQAWRGATPLAACLSLVLAGCGGFNATPRAPIDLQESLAGLAATATPRNVTDCLAQPLAAQRPCRDSLTQTLMVMIDIRYSQFEEEFFDAHRYTNFAATTAVLGLTGAAGLSSVPASTARVLAVIAAGITGARESFQRDVLAERTAVSLQLSMRARRNAFARRIRAGLREEPTKYSFGEALSDLFAYFRAGTIPGAVANVAEVLGSEAGQTRAAIDADVGVRGAGRAGQGGQPAAAPGGGQPAPPPRAGTASRDLVSDVVFGSRNPDGSAVPRGLDPAARELLLQANRARVETAIGEAGLAQPPSLADWAGSSDEAVARQRALVVPFLSRRR